MVALKKAGYMFLRHKSLAFLVGIVLFFGIVAHFTSSEAQNSAEQETLNRLQRMQNELTILQKFVYRGKISPKSRGIAPSSSVSPSHNVVARLSLRITQLENEIRSLTGQNEELSHQLRMLGTKLDKMYTDFDFRLRKPPSENKKSVDKIKKTKTKITSTTLAGSAKQIEGANKGVKLLGRIQGKTVSVQQGSGLPPPLKETPKETYDRGHILIVKKRNFPEAERVFRSFIAENKKHNLTPNAYYWLGRTYFVRGKFEDAAITFAEGFQLFPFSSKAPVTLLNLGVSLTKLGKVREACTTFSKLGKNYPKMGASVKRLLIREQQKSKCRRKFR